MGILIVVAVFVAVVMIVAALALRRRSANRSTAGGAFHAATTGSADDTAESMTDLESALDEVTDRQGRPMRELLDDETDHVDTLRVPDDTGPLLRRALDDVADADDAKPDAEPDAD